MRLGGPVFGETSSPESWISLVRAKGWRAVFCPLTPGAGDAAVQNYARAAAEAGVVIAEVGAWSNPLSRDEAERAAALEKCKGRLALADRVGARCCVNISGSRGIKWDGPDPANLTPETFEAVVASVREIIDAVKPSRTFYALETMPWMYPDSAESYARLLAAVDRERFAVHFDPVNLVCSPQLYHNNGAMIREFVERLGPHIRSCHAKDILLAERLTVHLDEVRPGLGALDYRAYLQALSALDPDTPLMLEHLPNEEEYDLAAAHLRRVAGEMGVPL